jgi:cytoskeletal protein RodZ
MISLMRAKHIQESPVPTDLFVRRRPAYLIPLIVTLAVVCAASIAFLLWFLLKPVQKDERLGMIITNITGGSSYRLSSEPLTRRLYTGDALIIPREEGEIVVSIASTLNSLALQTPIGVQFVELGEERELDIDGSAGAELIVFVSDISRTTASRGAEARVMLKTEVKQDSQQDAVVAETVLRGNSFVVVNDTRAYPFVLNISFRAACLLRYQGDRGSKIEDYYTSGDILTVQANNAVRLWVSNNEAAKVQLIADGKTHDIDITRFGRIAVCDVLWTRDGAGYHLAVTDID